MSKLVVSPLLLVHLLWLLLQGRAEVLPSALKDCVDEKIIQTGKKYRKQPPNEMFSFHYGHQSLEVFNVLSPLDMKKLTFLRQCVEDMDGSFFLNR